MLFSSIPPLVLTASLCEVVAHHERADSFQAGEPMSFEPMTTVYDVQTTVEAVAEYRVHFVTAF
jgi:hypothetical protein